MAGRVALERPDLEARGSVQIAVTQGTSEQETD